MISVVVEYNSKRLNEINIENGYDLMTISIDDVTKGIQYDAKSRPDSRQQRVLRLKLNNPKAVVKDEK